MRSERPRPGNPWPHDMVIRVDDNPNNVCELLFIRSAWGIPPDAAVPPLAPHPDPGDSSMPQTATAEEWSARWSHMWQRASDWYSTGDAVQQPSPEFLRALSGPGQPPHPAFPPFWRAEHGYDGINRHALNVWMRQLRPRRDLQLADTPERLCLPALIEAWEGGLVTVVTVPYSGFFARRMSATHLMVSNETRADPQSYKRALNTRPD